MTTKKAAPKKAVKAPSKKIVKSSAKQKTKTVSGLTLVPPENVIKTLSAYALLVNRLEALAASWESGTFCNQRDCAAQLREALSHE